MISVKPTDKQLKSIKAQAYDLGSRFELAYPGTHYDKETMIWDYASSPQAIKDLGFDEPYILPMYWFVEIHGINA